MQGFQEFNNSVQCFFVCGRTLGNFGDGNLGQFRVWVCLGGTLTLKTAFLIFQPSKIDRCANNHRK
eukprot:1572734-Amphidinium_carterae.1